MASSTATTCPLDSPSHIQRPLAEDIVIATRTVHARINKLVTARLPLALPPQAADPGAYVSGMLHFAPVYTTFEKLWQDILDAPPPAEEDNVLLFFSGGEAPPAPCRRVHSILSELHIPGLARSSRLEADLRALTGWTPGVLAEQLKTTGDTGRLRDFVRHIRCAVRERPHVLVAYSYIMYMALFAGGRFIRASFEGAGDEFWGAGAGVGAAPAVTEIAPQLRFWRFETAEDGEDLKREYKEKLLDCEGGLTAQERHDIVQESILIFESIGSIVHQLEEVSTRLRDSVLLAKERSARNASKHSSSSSSSSSSWLLAAIGLVLLGAVFTR